MGVRHIAVFRALELGDVLCAVPSLRALRAAYPDAEITFIGLPWSRELIRRFPLYVDHVMEFPGYPGLPEREPDFRKIPEFFRDAQARHFDLALQLHGSGSYVNSIVRLLDARQTAGFYLPGAYCPDSDLFCPYPESGHEISRLLRLTDHLGMPSQGTYLEFPLYEQDVRRCEELPMWTALRNENYICIHPGARWLSRRWTPEGFAAVADALSDEGYRIVFTGSSAEVTWVQRVMSFMRTPAIDVSGQTTLGSLGVLLRGSQLVICNDTGVSHVACGLGIPTVVIGLGSDLDRWAPLDREKHRLVSVPVHCRPCEYRVCPIEQPCAVGLSPNQVITAARQQLSSRKKDYEKTFKNIDLACSR
jgi:ADP-heptose:LPS heptosyltransferase